MRNSTLIMYIRQSRYQRGKGIGSFLRKVAKKGIQKLKSPAVKRLITKALKSPVVRSAVKQGAVQVIDTIVSSKTGQKILSNEQIAPIVRKVIAEITPKKKRVLSDINTILSKKKRKKTLKGWRKVSGKGIVLD